MNNESKPVLANEPSPRLPQTEEQAERLPYEPPTIESSEVFESFTLQSCNQFPNECGGALE